MTRQNIIRPLRTDLLKRYRGPAAPINILTLPTRLLTMPPQAQKSGTIQQDALLLLWRELVQAVLSPVRVASSKSRNPITKLLARTLPALSFTVILPCHIK